MFKIYDGRNYFYQWDLNRKLIVNDDSIKEVHFCNRSGDCSLVCEVYTENGINLVNVPNILLQKCFCINVYAFDGESTKHSTIYKVNPRSKPADYVYTETEVKNWENVIGRLDNLPIKEITVENITAPKFYIQELEKGIYTIKSLWTGTTVQRIMLYSGNTSLGGLGKGTILIVNNDSTIKNSSSSFRKAFLILQGGINDNAAVNVKCGTLQCIATTNEDNTISWTYENESGNILTANDKASSITNDTDISKLATVGAVKNHVKNSTVLLSNRNYEEIQRYTIEDDVSIFTLQNQKLDSVVMLVHMPTEETERIYKVAVGFGEPKNNYSVQTITHEVIKTKVDKKTGLAVRADALVSGYNFAANSSYTEINDSGVFPMATTGGTDLGSFSEYTYNFIKYIYISSVDEKPLPKGTVVLIKGVKK